MTEKHKNAITIALAALIVSIGLLYVFEPEGSIWESILKAVSLPRSLFSFLQGEEAEDEEEPSTEIVIPDEDEAKPEQVITGYNPDETPFDAFGDDEGTGFNGTSPVGGDTTEINELPVHQITGGGTP